MFADYPIIAGLAGLTVNGLTVSQTAVMTLELATGDATPQATGITSVLAAPASHAFASDPTKKTQCYMALVDNGTTVDLWVDEYVDDGKTTLADPPAGYRNVLALAWFEIAAGETDLANSVINRRVYQ